MLFRTLSAAVYGIDANLIDVEVDVATYRSEKENFMTVGLPDAAVRESRERIRAALKNCGYEMPQTKVTINLAPADLRKRARDSTCLWPWESWAPTTHGSSRNCLITFL